jgi:hypothetical protein
MFAGYLSHKGSALGQGKDVTISEDDQTTTLDCNGSDIAVSGDDNKITLKGECRKLTVSGDDNTINAMMVTELTVSGDDNNIKVETVARISASGDDNNITWKAGVGGKPPDISSGETTTKLSRETSFLS